MMDNTHNTKGESMNGKVVAITEDGVEVPVKVYHWWPGKTWAGPCPIEQLFVDDATDRGSRYMTVAYAPIGWQGCTVHVTEAAFCCPKDTPNRRMGRTIALGRLAKSLACFDAVLCGA